MALIAKLYSDDRSAERHALDVDATVRGSNHVPVDVLVANLSVTGCLFETAEVLSVGSVITIGLTGLGRQEATVVRAEGQRYGCEFATPLASADVSTALAAPSNTIVSFPLWAFGAESEDDLLPATYKLPGMIRIPLMLCMAAASWAAIIATAAWLR